MTKLNLLALPDIHVGVIKEVLNMAGLRIIQDGKGNFYLVGDGK